MPAEAPDDSRGDGFLRRPNLEVFAAIPSDGGMSPRKLPAGIAWVAAGFLLGAPRAAVAGLVPASQAAFQYDGRIDFRDPRAPVLIWEGTRVAVDFTGPSLALDFRDATGQNFFNATVDGATQVVAANAGAPDRIALGRFSPGRHHLVLYKRTEASAGTVAFAGIELAPGADVAAPARPRYEHRFVFYGDSITVGACNEDGPRDQWIDRRTHDAARSYPAFAARALDADLRNISVSGMGISEGWVPMTAGEVWNRLYPDAASPTVDVAAFHPDVVFVNFGENDCSYSAQHGEPFPATFTARYEKLVSAMRAAYPGAEIVLLRGGMSGGAKNPHLRAAWSAAVSDLEAHDPRIAHYVFRHWSSNHPRVPDDRALAAELVRWLREQPWLQPAGRAAL